LAHDLRVGPVDRHPHVAHRIDVDIVDGDALLPLHTRTVRDPELPVVPRAGEQLAVELALGEAVALVGAGVVDGVDTAGRAHEAHAMAVDLDHLHRTGGEVGEVGDGGGPRRGVVLGLDELSVACVHVGPR
jgi:hypothetical protein